MSFLDEQGQHLAICETCGTQCDVPLSKHPQSCRVCDDPRQYVPVSGQTWTSLKEEQKFQTNTIETDAQEKRIHFITTRPLDASELAHASVAAQPKKKQLGIGERAILLQTEGGNILWDLVAFLDQKTIDAINELGGLKAIVISHPHFYTTHLEWARVFDCPVYMCKDDEVWLNRADEQGRRRLFNGALSIEEVGGAVKVIQCGGHFDGSSVLLWTKEKKLFIADTIMSVPSGYYHKDRLPGTVSYSFQWSYPNMIPLPPAKVHGLWKAVKPYDFNSTYGAFAGQNNARADLKGQLLESMKIFCSVGGHDSAAILQETLS